MTEKEHLKRHKMLHENLDELVAEFIMYTKALPSRSTVMELIEWSHQQTVLPSHSIGERSKE